MRNYFIAQGDVCLCGDCNARLQKFDPGDQDVGVWEFFSRGWLGPMVCDDCGLSLPVYVEREGDGSAESDSPSHTACQ